MKNLFNKMTATDYHLEWMYLFEERLGMLCGKAEPDQAQLDLAANAADAIAAMYGGPKPEEYSGA